MAPPRPAASPQPIEPSTPDVAAPVDALQAELRATRETLAALGARLSQLEQESSRSRGENLES